MLAREFASAHGHRDEPGEARRRLRHYLPADQKYEKGTNRMGASRLHQIARFRCRWNSYYEGVPGDQGSAGSFVLDRDSRWVTDFLATSEGLELIAEIATSTHRRKRQPSPDRRYDDGPSGLYGHEGLTRF